VRAAPGARLAARDFYDLSVRLDNNRVILAVNEVRENFVVRDDAEFLLTRLDDFLGRFLWCGRPPRGCRRSRNGLWWRLRQAARDTWRGRPRFFRPISQEIEDARDERYGSDY
jgi:hypothetical protein